VQRLSRGGEQAPSVHPGGAGASQTSWPGVLIQRMGAKWRARLRLRVSGQRGEVGIVVALLGG